MKADIVSNIKGIYPAGIVNRPAMGNGWGQVHVGVKAY